MTLFNLNIKKIKFSIYTILFFVFFLYSSVPFSKYLFIPLIVLALIINKQFIKQNIFSLAKNAKWYIVLILIYTYSLFGHNCFEFLLLKDLFYGVTVFMLAFLYKDYSNQKKCLFKNKTNLFIYLTVLISIISIVLYVFSTKNIFSTSLVNDENMFVLPFLFSLVLILFYKVFSKKDSLWILILCANIGLSTSRRGLIFLLAIFAVYTVKNCYIFFVKRKVSLKNSYLPIIVFLVLLFVSVPFLRYVSDSPRIIRLVRSYNYVLNSQKVLMSIVEIDENIIPAGSNLIANGTFDKGMEGWKVNGDSTAYSLIPTQQGNAIRIHRYGADLVNYHLTYNGEPLVFLKDKEYIIEFKCRLLQGDLNSFNVGYYTYSNSKDYNISNKLITTHETLADNWFLCSTPYKFIDENKKHVFFLRNLKKNTVIDISHIKLYCSDSLSSTDLYLNKYLMKESSIHGLFNDRFDKWTYAWELWENEYSTIQKFIGKGFKYRTYYANYFYTDSEKEYEYPHNPIISAFLYSGLIGGIILITFFVLSFYYYIKNIKGLHVLFSFYIITFVFCFFSGNSIFSVPVFSFLSLVPFIVND